MILWRPLVVIHKIIAYEGIIDLNFSRSFEKISAERIPDRSSKNSCILKDVAFISDKAALEHLLKPSLSS